MPRTRENTPLKIICHPFLFALKEGNEIIDDPLDYSLLLLQRSCTEVIKSPPKRMIRFSKLGKEQCLALDKVKC